MPDAVYKNINFIFKSLGINARDVTDALPEGTFLNLDNCEELAEASLSNRLGTTFVNRIANTCVPLAGPVYSLAKLSSLNGVAYRYAGAGSNLYRRSASGIGAYSLIASGMSGQQWQAQAYGATQFTSLPYMFFADANGMLKDDGTFNPPQQMGIFQPQFPVKAVAQGPAFAQLEPAPAGATRTTSGITDFLAGQPEAPNTTLTSAVTATGQQAVSVADTSELILYQFVTVGTGGGAESLLVLKLTTAGFVGMFTKTHAVGSTVIGLGVQGTVTSTGVLSTAFAAPPIKTIYSKTLQQEDYIGVQIHLSDPTAIQQIILKFDCGDGSFETDYFYKVIGQGPLQNLLNQASQPSTAATDAIITEALGVYGEGDGSIAELNVGQNAWTPLLIQLSDFAASGQADFSDQTHNWQNVNGYQLTIVTNSTGESVDFALASMVLFGGAGPDTFAGVAYDYLFTFFNIVDGTESNPCMVMSNVNPPNQTNWVYPRRQPVLLTMNTETFRSSGQLQDMQITHVRIYRRGGTLGDNYRRVDQIPINISAAGLVQYTDTAADDDIQSNDFISFENDVPVTSSLPVPVATTVAFAVTVTGAGAAVTVQVGSIANLSIGQQVSIGTPGALANNFETVIVIGIISNGFAAFVQNSHALGEPVSATATYGQPVTIMAQGFGLFWYAGDPNNPNLLYYSSAANPQYVSSAAYVPVSSPDDAITAIVQFKGNLYVSTTKGWWSVAPGSQQGQSPTVYPTACKHGCIAQMGVIATEEAIFYQANDGIRAFAGGASTYLTQNLEFLFQGVGSSPIVEANQALLNQTQMAYWNNMVFCSYVGLDGNRHRVILHTVYKRWRNDDVDANCMLLEADTNTLVFGDTGGMVNLDRQDRATDEQNNGGTLLIAGISATLQTPYSDQGMPSIKKSYQELTLDILTNGEEVDIFLWFEDGQSNFLVGSVNNTVRQKVNFILNNGLGYEYYKVSLQLHAQNALFWYAYQASLKSLPLAKTRTSFDTFKLKLGTDESKMAKQVYFEFTCTADVGVSVYYDDSTVAGFAFTLPNSNGVRNPMRVRMPAVNFRMIRFVGLSANDFQIWDSSKIEYKLIGTGKGWQAVEFVENG